MSRVSPTECESLLRAVGLQVERAMKPTVGGYGKWIDASTHMPLLVTI